MSAEGKAKRLKNLKPFKKGRGKDRDPNICDTTGYKHKLPDLREVMANVLGEPQGSGKAKRTRWEAIVSRMSALAAKGNVRAAEALKEWGFGKSPQTIAVLDGRKEADQLFPPDLEQEVPSK